MVRVVAVLAVVVQLASPALAKNPYLPAAKRLWASLDYEEALQELERARQFAGTTPQELVEIEVYTGLLDYELGRVAEADAAFEHALALDPSACLPDEVSPKEKVAFAATKARIASLKLPADRPKAAPASGKTTIDRPVAAAPRPAEP